MKRLPDALFVVDSNNEAIAVKEARKLGIPGGRRRRHQLRSHRGRLRDPRQRRRAARHSPVHLEDRRLGGRGRADGRRQGLRRSRSPCAGWQPEVAIAPTSASACEEVDLEAALGGGIRKAPAAVAAALDEAEVAEGGD